MCVCVCVCVYVYVYCLIAITIMATGALEHTHPCTNPVFSSIFYFPGFLCSILEHFFLMEEDLLKPFLH